MKIFIILFTLLGILCMLGAFGLLDGQTHPWQFATAGLSFMLAILFYIVGYCLNDMKDED